MFTKEEIKIAKDIKEEIERLDEGEGVTIEFTPEATRVIYFAMESLLDVAEDSE